METPILDGIEIPWQNLSEDALTGVIDEFILRDGTDYGEMEASLDKKRKDVLVQLRTRRARLLYDPETESITLSPCP